MDVEEAQRKLEQLRSCCQVTWRHHGTAYLQGFPSDFDHDGRLPGTDGTDAQPLAIGGGTYAQALPNIVGFGPVPRRPDMPTTNNGARLTSSWPAALYREVLKRLAE